MIAVSFESLSGIPTLFSSLSSAGVCSIGSSCTNRAGLPPVSQRESGDGIYILAQLHFLSGLIRCSDPPTRPCLLGVSRPLAGEGHHPLLLVSVEGQQAARRALRQTVCGYGILGLPGFVWSSGILLLGRPHYFATLACSDCKRPSGQKGAAHLSPLVCLCRNLVGAGVEPLLWNPSGSQPAPP